MGIWITTVSENETQVKLRVEGQLVADWSSVLRQECQTLLGQGREVVLDCSRLAFIDSRGVAVLKQLQTEGLRMAQAPPLMKDIFEGQ